MANREGRLMHCYMECRSVLLSIGYHTGSVHAQSCGSQGNFWTSIADLQESFDTTTHMKLL